MKGQSSLSGRLIHNTILNAGTQLALMVLALVSIPILVNTLTEDSFGLLMLVWSFIGYFTLLDFGVSKAITKFIAEAKARNEATVATRYAGTSIIISLVAGLGMVCVFLVGGPYVFRTVFDLEPDLSARAIKLFTRASIGIPFVLMFGSVKGSLMGIQRFDVANLLQGGVGTAQMGGALVLVVAGFDLEEIILLTVCVRIIFFFVSAVVGQRLIPGMFSVQSLYNREALKRLLSFGGWVTVSQLVTPLYLYLDRMMIGAMISLSAVTYYTIPQEGLLRLLVLPVSLTLSLFPVFSELSAIQMRERGWGALYVRSLKYLVYFTLPLVAVLIVFAREFLTVWVGEELATESYRSLQMLSVGILFAMLSQLPMTALFAVGRPDLPAKFHLFEIPLLVILNILLIPAIGILGAAVTWTIRLAIDSALLFGAAWKLNAEDISAECARQFLHRRLGIVTFLICGAVPVMIAVEDIVLRIALGGVLGLVYLAGIWTKGLDQDEREKIIQGLRFQR